MSIREAFAPTIAALVSLEVASYEDWKRTFGLHAPARREAGIVEIQVNRVAEDANRLILCLSGNQREQIESYLGAGFLDSLAAADVQGHRVTLVTPIEDQLRKDGPHPATIVRHEVRDFATWKRVFDDWAPKRAARGLLGHSVGRSVAHPNVTVVCVQASSHAQLRALGRMADLHEAMRAGGVIGPPETTYVDQEFWPS